MKALVIYKKSQYQIYVEERKNAHIEGLISSGSESTKGMLASHEQHNRTLDEVVRTLEHEGFGVRTRYRAGMDMVKDADIVFTVGGDGTLLWTQKFIGAGIPLFGVNSDPPRSVGALCAAAGSNFKEILRGYMNPKKLHDAARYPIQRMEVLINGNSISSRVLNDVLFCHKNPAAVSAYFVRHPAIEPQKSSGVWVSTAAGSTGAIRSAGGEAMKFTSELFQWRVREPYEPGATKYQNKQGYIERGGMLTLQSKMRNGMIALDGSRDSYGVEMGDLVMFQHSHEPLTLVK